MKFFGRGPKLAAVRDAAQTLLQAPSVLSYDWALNVHAAYPAVDGFARSITGTAAELSDTGLDGWAHALADRDLAMSSVRAAAWTAEVLRHRTGMSRRPFCDEFGVMYGEEPLAEFVPDNPEGDELRIARLGIEVMLRSAGQLDPGQRYAPNVPALMMWHGSISHGLTAYAEFVNQFTEDGHPGHVLRFIAD